MSVQEPCSHRSSLGAAAPASRQLPIWLKLSTGPAFAVLHEPHAPPPRAKAVLLLAPFGWDNDNAYRALRDWAAMLADGGVYTLRFDLPGTENSFGSAADSGLLQAWTQATIEAARWLRARSRGGRLTAVGIGLSGLVAYQAAGAGSAVDDLALWATRASGRAHIRELQAYAGAADHQRQLPPGPAGAQAGGAALDGLSVAGHWLSAETLADLRRVELAAQPLPGAPCRRVLLIGRDRLGVDPALHNALRATGAQVTVSSGEDYHRLVAAPEYVLRPAQTFAAFSAWLAADPAPDGDLASERRDQQPVPVASQEVQLELDGLPVRERIALVPTGAGSLVGVISEPLTRSASPCCALVANTLAFRHTGPGRLNVAVARRLAARGIASARFDLPGIGDSDGRSLAILERTAADQQAAVAALSAIADHVASLGIAERFLTTGICSGGLLALRAAAADRRVLAVAAVNPPALRSGRAPLAATRRGAREQQGRPNRVATTRLRARLAEVRLLWQLAHWAETRAAAHDLNQLAGLDARILLVLSRQEPLARMLDTRRLATRLRRAANIELSHLDGGDHFVRAPSAQARVLELIVAHLADQHADTGRPDGRAR